MHALTLTPSPPGAVATEIRVGRGAIGELGARVPIERRALLVVDAALGTAGLVAEAVRLLGAHRDTVTLALAGGEEAKTLASIGRLWDRWIEAGAGRDSVVVAMGGGSITDAAGFAAACFHRGVPWIAVPTTILGMADAAIGGKTGINLAAGKNLAGAVHHPLAVLADLDALATLDATGHADGWAEVIKAGVVGDEALLESCERQAAAIRGREAGPIEELLVAAIRVKAAVVEADAAENSRREILNFGHTIGHALERVFSGLPHGRAVALGMVAEARLAVDRGRLPPGTPERIRDACRAIGLPAELPGDVPEAAFLQAIRVDKKRRSGRVRVALPERLGAHSDVPGVAVEESELWAAVLRLGRAD